MNKKIIFWIDSNPFTFILAHSLQKKLSYELYSITDITDKPKKFFQNQNFVSFKQNWFLHDNIKKNLHSIDYDFLTLFEEKYGINLWLLSQNERLFNHYNEYYLFSTNEILSILEDECKLYDSILEEVKPDFFITKETALHHHHLFYEMCRAKNVKILMLNQSKFGYKCLISQELHKLDFPENLEHVKSNNRNFDQLQDYLKSFNMQKQLIDHKNKFLSSKKEKIKAALEFLFFTKNTNIQNNFAYRGRTKLRVLYKEFFYSLQTRKNENYLNMISSDKIPTSKFVYFPLHQEPERVLLIGSPFYTNQLETIRHIAKSLPIDYSLVVKEHPTQSIRGWHKPEFYQLIQNLPNVTLLHPSTQNDKIFKNCSLVISVNGTAGLEAAFYGKPSIIFTDLGYSILPSVNILNSISSLPDLIRKTLKIKVNNNDVDRYVNLIEENSFDFDLFKFITSYQNYFYYGGHLADVEIPLEKMKNFIEDQRSLFDSLSEYYLKKIEEL